MANRASRKALPLTFLADDEGSNRESRTGCYPFSKVFFTTSLSSSWDLVSRTFARLGIATFGSPFVTVVAALLLLVGFLKRVWATAYFYTHNMLVISRAPQNTLITNGPYRFSRNPLYLGGNVFIFFGAALFLGSPTAFVATAIHIPLIDLFISREEKEMEREFGDEWQKYVKRVRRWL